LRIVCTVSSGVRDDGPVVDRGCLVGAANFLTLLGGGPLRALVGGVASLVAAGVSLAVIHDSKAAALFAALAAWCCFAAWFTHRFPPR
jgi:hypothetical protein